MKKHCERKVEMKQRKIVSMVGFVGVLIGVTVLITACKQANNGTHNNESTISQGLEGGVFANNYNGYYQYSGGIVYMAVYDNGRWVKFATGSTYHGNVVSGSGTSVTATVDASRIRFPNGEFLSRVTDKQIISLIRSLPISSAPAD